MLEAGETPPDVMIGSGDEIVRIQDGIGYYYAKTTDDNSTGDRGVKIYGLHEYGRPWRDRLKALRGVTLDEGRIIYM